MNKTTPPSDRFWKKVNIAGADDCWEWYRIPATFYPVFGLGSGRADKRCVPAHRAAYILTHGEPPKGSYICHKCGNRLCCNPNHLYAGTQKQNIEDAIRHGTFSYPPMRRGEEHGSSKYSDRFCEILREIYPMAVSKRALALAFGMPEGVCRRIGNGKCRNHDIQR